MADDPQPTRVGYRHALRKFLSVERNLDGVGELRSPRPELPGASLPQLRVLVFLDLRRSLGDDVVGILDAHSKRVRSVARREEEGHPDRGRKEAFAFGCRVGRVRVIDVRIIACAEFVVIGRVDGLPIFLRCEEARQVPPGRVKFERFVPRVVERSDEIGFDRAHQMRTNIC